MNGAQALILSLLQEGVEHIFGYAGATICPAVDALKEHPEIGYTLVRTEQNAGHMASGYARVSGKVGVCMVTSGPAARRSRPTISVIPLNGNWAIPSAAAAVFRNCVLLPTDICTILFMFTITCSVSLVRLIARRICLNAMRERKSFIFLCG